ncbi:MAG: hypothetical protein ACFCU5_08950 [Pleurocapsa sp.]
MKLNCKNLPVILGVGIIISVMVGLTAIITSYLNDSAARAKEAEESIYSQHKDSDFKAEDTEQLIVPVPEPNPRGTGVPVESHLDFGLDNYSSDPSASGSSGYSYSSSISYSDRPFSPFDDRSNTRNLSSQSLTRPNFSDNSSSTGINNQNLLDSPDDSNSLGSLNTTSSTFNSREQENSRVDAFSENSGF